MVDFRAYSSIENSYRGKDVGRIRNEEFDKVEWVALEKVHGANFGLWIIDGKIVPSKRSSFADGSFYGCQSVVEAMGPLVLKLAEHGVTVVYGELFGGGIQKGINYGEKRFAAFDMKICDQFVDYDKFVELCDLVGLPRCVEIARGSFDDILAIDPAFPTKMSDCGATDIAEGFVMKPVKNSYLRLGDRIILKKKSPGFSERTSEKTPRPPKEPLTELQKSIFDAAQGYICDERIESATSKFGERDFNPVLTEVLSDIYRELEKDGLDSLDLSSYNSVRQEMCNLLAPMIRKQMFGPK
jgi:Rnl2 family RNA ligase